MADRGKSAIAIPFGPRCQVAREAPCCTAKTQDSIGACRYFRQVLRGLADLVGDARQALLSPQHGEHVENPRRGAAAGECGPERLRHRTELEPLRFGEAADRLLGGLCIPGAVDVLERSL